MASKLWSLSVRLIVISSRDSSFVLLRPFALRLLRFGQSEQTRAGDTGKRKDLVMPSRPCSLAGTEDAAVARATAALGDRPKLLRFIDFACQPSSKGL